MSVVCMSVSVCVWLWILPASWCKQWHNFIFLMRVCPCVHLYLPTANTSLAWSLPSMPGPDEQPPALTSPAVAAAYPGAYPIFIPCAFIFAAACGFEMHLPRHSLMPFQWFSGSVAQRFISKLKLKSCQWLSNHAQRSTADGRRAAGLMNKVYLCRTL